MSSSAQDDFNSCETDFVKQSQGLGSKTFADECWTLVKDCKTFATNWPDGGFLLPDLQDRCGTLCDQSQTYATGETQIKFAKSASRFQKSVLALHKTNLAQSIRTTCDSMRTANRTFVTEGGKCPEPTIEQVVTAYTEPSGFQYQSARARELATTFVRLPQDGYRGLSKEPTMMDYTVSDFVDELQGLRYGLDVDGMRGSLLEASHPRQTYCNKAQEMLTSLRAQEEGVVKLFTLVHELNEARTVRR